MKSKISKTIILGFICILLVGCNQKSQVESITQGQNKQINILWLGTSIPMGNSDGNYPAIVEELMNDVTVYNISKSASTARGGFYEDITEDDSIGYRGFKDNVRALMKCVSLSAEEKQRIYNNWEYEKQYFSYDGNFDTGSDNMDLYRSCSYDSDLKEYLAQYDIDYVIYDMGYNDAFCSPYADTDMLEYNGGGVSTYIDASLFIFDKIKEYSPNTEIIIAGHYSNEDYPKVALAQEKLSVISGYPLYKTWEYTGWTMETVKVNGHWEDGYWVETEDEHEMTVIDTWCPDGVHPGNDKSQRSNKYLADIHAKCLRGIIGK